MRKRPPLGASCCPTAAKEKPKEGVVIALGDGRVLDDGNRSEFTVAKNDRVLFSSYAGTEVKIDGDEYLLIAENDILAIIS